MKIITKRLDGQSIRDYRVYLIQQKRWIKVHLQGKLMFNSDNKKSYKAPVNN